MSTNTPAWTVLRQDVVEAVAHGVTATDHFETELLGPRTFERVDYPAAQVYPDTTTRTDGNEYTHTVEANLVFERTRDYDYYEDILHPMGAVITEVLAALANTPSVISYYPNAVEDFAGELDNTGVIVLRIEFQATQLVEFSETAPE